MRRHLPVVLLLACGVPTTLIPITASAQVGRRAVDPRRLTAELLLKPITVSFTDARLEDVMTFLADFTGATFNIMWLDDRSATGMDKNALVTLSVNNAPALTLLERVLKRASDNFDAATWQFSAEGEMEIGPKSRLNELATIKIYDIRDLLFQIQPFIDVPDLGLGEITQGQGGSSTSDFEIEEREGLTEEELTDSIVDLIVKNLDPDQWVDAGGPNSVTVFNKALVIRAPDYIHRQLVAYSFWPTSSAGRATRPGRIGAADRNAAEYRNARRIEQAARSGSKGMQ